MSKVRAFAWAAVALALSACASATAQDERATSAERAAECLPEGADTRGWSARRRMVHAAVCEWAAFGFPTVVVRLTPDDRSNRLPGELALSETLSEAVAPSVAALPDVRQAAEVQVRFGRTESDLAVYERIAAYWRATSPGYARAVEAAGRERPRLRPGWWTAWSAAFTSWALREAGVDWIPADDNHSVYLRGALQARPVAVTAIERYRPVAGDLVCLPRLSPEGPPDARAGSAGFIERLRSGPSFPAHCDIVVRRNDRSVVVIGGNVKNAVTATVVPLDARGRLVRTSVRPWTVAVSLGEPADPCARIEAVTAPGWDAPAVAAARRRALGRSC